MKKLKRIISLLIIVVLSISIVGCKEKNVLAEVHRKPEEVYKLTFSAIGEDVMPIGTYSGPHSSAREYKGQNLPSMISEKYFTEFEDIGINFFTSTLSSDDENIEAFMDLCDAHNMGAFISFEDMEVVGSVKYASTETIESNLDQLSSHKSLIGYYLRDEPTLSLIEKAGERIVANFKKSKYANTHYTYANALYDCGPEVLDKAGSAITWTEYLESFIENLDVKYLSYDFYPFWINESGKVIYNSGYMKNLSVARKIANKYKIPLWTCKECGTVNETVPLSKLTICPDEARFRWHTTVDLAYGVKGFTYFLLCGDNLAYDNEENYEVGMDQYYGLYNGYTGEQNVWCSYAKEFKSHLVNIEKILLNSYNDGIITVGYVTESTGIGEERIKSGKYYELTKAEGCNSIIGCFNYEGKTALYVTNNSYLKAGTIKLTFDNNYSYDVYQGSEIKKMSGTEIELSLKEGEGVLVMPCYA